MMSHLSETPLLASTLIDPYIRVNSSVETCLRHVEELASDAKQKYGDYKYRVDRKFYIELFDETGISGTIESLKINRSFGYNKTYTINRNKQNYAFYALDDKNRIKMNVTRIPAREVRLATIALMGTSQRCEVLHNHPEWCKQILKTKEISFKAYTVARNLIRIIQIFVVPKTTESAKLLIGNILTNAYLKEKIPLPKPLKEKLLETAIKEAKNIARELTILALYLH
jgi:hypothetical protein